VSERLALLSVWCEEEALPRGVVVADLLVSRSCCRLGYVMMEKAGVGALSAVQSATEGVWAVLSALSVI